MLYNWLYPLHTEYSFLNVFRYLSFRIIYAAVTAFLIAFVLGTMLVASSVFSDRKSRPKEDRDPI